MRKSVCVKEIARLTVWMFSCVICFYLSFKTPSVLYADFDARGQSFCLEWFIGGGMFAFMFGLELFCYKYEQRTKKGEK